MPRRAVKVRITPRAQHDLEEIRRWIARDDADTALSFVRDLRRKIGDLDATPKRYPVATRRPGYPVFRLNHRGYRIFFRVRTDQVDVLAVHHGSRGDPAF